MRQLQHLVALFACVTSSSIAVTTPADHHLMQIEQVIGGVNGDTSAQAIQLRMRGLFQNNLAAARLRVFDASGQNPVMLIDFDDVVPNFQLGDRVLITTNAFDKMTNPTCVPDFTMTNRIPDSYLAAGSLVFEDDFGTIWWRLSWGGSGYTGSNAGDLTNDNDGDFGPPWPGPLPSSSTQALLFQGTASDASTTNADDYALTTGAAVFTNNARISFVVEEATPPINVPLVDVAVTFGSLISGTLQSIETSDNQFLRTRSRFGFTSAEPNLIVLRIGGASPELSPATIGVSIEDRISQNGGTVRVRVRTWSTNQLVQVHQYSQGTTEHIEAIEDLAAADRVRQTDGRVELEIRTSVFTTFTAAGFDQFTDHVNIEVEL